MKKEWLACCTLLLIALGAAVNIIYLRHMTLEIEVRLDAADAACTRQAYPEAEAALNQALDLWRSAEGYTHIFIRHSEVDATTESLYEAISDAKDHPAEVKTSIRHLRHQLHELRSMDTPRWGSVF